jgi:hypothetical protein
VKNLATGGAAERVAAGFSLREKYPPIIEKSPCKVIKYF